MMQQENAAPQELILYESSDGAVKLKLSAPNDAVWLTANQMAALFDKDAKTIRKHIHHIFADAELEREDNTKKMRVIGMKQPVPFYSLDVILSVGYRVKSKRGIEFRRWANGVLKDYILQGYAANQERLRQLRRVVSVMQRVQNTPDATQVLSVIERFNTALDLLDNYDHQTLGCPQGRVASYVLSYEECRKLIDAMHYGDTSTLFGNEKDDSFRGSIGAIYQTFGGKEVYPTLEEKAANLLYFVTKNHSFSDGNKRIAAALFLYFLEKNGALFVDGEKRIDDYALAALTILIAESHPEEKEMMVSVVMNCIGNTKEQCEDETYISQVARTLDNRNVRNVSNSQCEKH